MRFAASLVFWRIASSTSDGGPISIDITRASAIFSASAYNRPSGSPTFADWMRFRNTTQSRGVDSSRMRQSPTPASRNTVRIRLKLA